MSHKINAHGIRIGINKQQDSVWFADKKTYSDFVSIDDKVRKYIKSKLTLAGIASIIIRRGSTINIEITVAKPGIVIGRGGKGIEELKAEISKIAGEKVDVKIVEAKNPDTVSAIVAANVGDQCVRRVAPKMAMQRELAKIKANKDVLGVKIWVSGRIKGTEIARTEKVQYGSVPLHTLRADIDYAFHVVRVPNAGLHGIKVWIYKGEKKEISYSEE
jgi:small subunit ribosomal protein S3